MALSEHPSLKLGHCEMPQATATNCRRIESTAGSSLCFPHYSWWQDLLWSLGTLGDVWRCQQVTRKLGKSSSDKETLDELGCPNRTFDFHLNIKLYLFFWAGSSSERQFGAKTTCWLVSSIHRFFSSHLPAVQQTWPDYIPSSPSTCGTKFAAAWPSLITEHFSHGLQIVTELESV